MTDLRVIRTEPGQNIIEKMRDLDEVHLGSLVEIFLREGTTPVRTDTGAYLFHAADPVQEKASLVSLVGYVQVIDAEFVTKRGHATKRGYVTLVPGWDQKQRAQVPPSTEPVTIFEGAIHSYRKP